MWNEAVHAGVDWSAVTASINAIDMISKGGVIGITRSLAREGGEFGITVNCIAPGLTNSDDEVPEERWAVRVPERAIKRVEMPEDLVGAAIFFMSADSDFMTGQTIIIDGGIAIN